MTKPIFDLPVPQPGQTSKELLDSEVNRVVDRLWPLAEGGASDVLDEVNQARDEARAWATTPEDEPVETDPDRFSALHWAEKAADNAASIDPAAFVRRDGTQGMQGDLPMGGNNITALGDAEAVDEALAAGQIGNPAFYGASPTASAATNDAAFVAMLSALGGRQVDLGGLSYPVTEVPALNAVNGFWAVPSFEGDLTALIAAGQHLPVARSTIYSGPLYGAWCQDNLAVWDSDAYLFFSVGESHTGGAGRLPVSVRRRGGVWQQFEYVLPGEAGNWISAACIGGGVQMMLRRDEASGDYRLFARRLSKRYELRDCLNGGPQYGGAGSNFAIEFDDVPSIYERLGEIGAVEGMTAVITGVGDIQGQTISGPYSVGFINPSRIQFSTGTPFASDFTGAGGEFQISFVESAWQEITIRDSANVAGPISDAVKEARGVGAGSLNLHDMAFIPRSYGSFLAGVSRDTSIDSRCGLIRCEGPWDTISTGAARRKIAWFRELPDAQVPHTEPTVAIDPDTGKIYGFARSQTFDTPPLFWWSPDQDITTNGTGTTFAGSGFAAQSPISIALVGDYIFGLASGTRTGEDQGIDGHIPADVPIYLLWATKADAEAQGAAAFQWTVIDWVRYENQFFGVASAVGVPSLAALDGRTLLATYGGDGRTATGSPHVHDPAYIFAAKVDISSIVRANGEPRETASADAVATPNQFYMQLRQLAATADGEFLKFLQRDFGTPRAQRIYDSATGYFYPPETGLYEIRVQISWAVRDGSNALCHLTLVDSADASVIDAQIAAGQHPGNNARFITSGAVLVQLREGQRVRLKVSAADGIEASIARNIMTVRKLT